jgi:hypothetical protein
MDRHAQLMGWSDHWGEDDYVVLDQGRSVGRIHKEAHDQVVLVNQHEPVSGAAAAQWRHHNSRPAKQEFRTRCEEMRRMGVRPFG